MTDKQKAEKFDRLVSDLRFYFVEFRSQWVASEKASRTREWNEGRMHQCFDVLARLNMADGLKCQCDMCEFKEEEGCA